MLYGNSHYMKSVFGSWRAEGIDYAHSEKCLSSHHPLFFTFLYDTRNEPNRHSSFASWLKTSLEGHCEMRQVDKSFLLVSCVLLFNVTANPEACGKPGGTHTSGSDGQAAVNIWDVSSSSSRLLLYNTYGHGLWKDFPLPHALTSACFFTTSRLHVLALAKNTWISISRGPLLSS